jgi:drug/metabolite transporter (DMT)-like permease
MTVSLWGSAFVGIRSAGHTFSPGALALGRLVVSCVALGALALARRQPLPNRRDLGLIAIYGVLWLGLYSVTLNAAEHRVDAGVAAMLVNTGPIILAILAGIFLREGFPRSLFVGCAVALGGTAMIGFATAHSSHAGLGIALCILAAFAYSSAIVVQKPVLARVDPLQVTFFACVAATVACLPFAPSLAHGLAHAHASTIGWTVYLGLGPTAAGFVAWSFALGRTSAGSLGSLTYLAPLVAILLGWAVLGETPKVLAVAGGGVCLVGVYLARRRPRVGVSAPERDADGLLSGAPVHGVEGDAELHLDHALRGEHGGAG